MERDQEKSLKILTRKALKTIRIYDEDDDEEGDILEDRFGRVKVKPKVKGKKNGKLNANPLLRDGKPLPKTMQKDFSDAVACVPLEEFDPYYTNQQTFVVIGKKKTIHRFSAKRVTFLLSPFSLIRRAAIYVLTHWIFSAFIVATVLINCLILLTGVPEKFIRFLSKELLHNEFSPERLNFVLELVFISIYTFELCLKLIARGVILDRFTCFRIPWSWLDLFIIAGSLASSWVYLPILDSIKALRVLKIVPLIPELHDGFELVVNTALRLLEMCLYALIPITGFSILAQKLYFNTLRSKCVQNNVRSIRNTTRFALFNFPSASCKNESFWYKDSETEYTICGNYSGTRSCPEGYTCQPKCGESPNDGQTSFESLPWTIFTIVRLLFQDYPQELYNQVWDAVGPWYTIFFLLVFFIGTFAIGVLAYGIVSNSIIQKTKQENQAQEEALTVPTSITVLSNESSESSYFVNKVHPLAEIFITFVIIIDILVLCLFYSDELVFGKTQRITRWICIFLYSMEAKLKLIVCGPRIYFKEAWNIFDLVIAVLGSFTVLSAEICPYFLPEDQIQYLDNVVSILFHVLHIRMLKIVPRCTCLRILADVIWNSIKLFWSLLALLAAFLFIFTIFSTIHLSPTYSVGSYLFPGQNYPRWNFMNYPHSFMVGFRLLAGEWIETFRNCFVVANYTCLIYYIPGVLIGHILVIMGCVSIACTTVAVLKSEELNPREKTALTKAFEWLQSRHPCVLIKSLTINRLPKTRRELTEAQEYRPGIEEPDWAPEGRTIDGISFTVILISWLPLVIDSVQNANSYALFGVIFYTDIIFAIYFVVEVAYKVYYKGPKACLTSIGWLFDLLLVSGTFANLYLYQINSAHFPLKETFNLRCLRIFMLVSRVYCLKVVGNGLLKQIGSVKSFILAGLFIWLVFAIEATWFFNLKFSKCIDPSDNPVPDLSILVRSQPECLANKFNWESSYSNFNGLPNSFLSLVQAGSLNGFAKITEDASDIPNKSSPQVTDASYYANIFFVVFFVVGIFLLFNIIFGVVLYDLQKDKNAGIFMTKEQLRKYKQRRQNINLEMSFSYPKPKYLLQIIYDFVADWRFDVVVMLTICLDIVTFVFYKYQDAKHWSMLLRLIYIIILALFTIELILKLLAWGRHYFRNFYNVIDFCVVLYGILDYVFGGLLVWQLYPTVLRIARILRFLQFQPLLRHCGALRNLMTSFVLIKSVLFNFLFFFLVFIGSFGTMGMALFKHLKFEAGITSYANFQSFPNTLIALFELSTFAGWNTITLGMNSDSNNCQRTSPVLGQCSNYSYGVAYVLVYLTVSFLVVMNMYLVFLKEFVAQLIEQEENDKLAHLKLLQEKEQMEKEPLIEQTEALPIFANCQPVFQEKSHCRPKKKEIIRETVKDDEFLLESVPEEPEQCVPPEQPEHEAPEPEREQDVDPDQDHDHEHQLQRLSSSESHSIFSSREFLWNSNIKVGSSSNKIDMLDCRHKAKFNYEELGRSAWSPENVESIILSKDDSDPPVVILINSWQNDVLI